MTFYDGQEENREIIKDYFINKNYIKVNYLYTDNPDIIIYTKEKEEEIINLMIEQALKRDEELYDKTYKETLMDLSQTLLSMITVILSLKSESQLLLCFSFIVGLIGTTNLINNYEKLREMKKFRLYNFMKEELDKKENQDITKIIEFDPFYREPINMGTLDNFSYRAVKNIKKELKRRNNIIGNTKKA